MRSEAVEPDEAMEEAKRADLARAFGRALAGLVAARRAEGAKLAVVLGTLLDEIAGLHAEATREAAGQPEAQRAKLRELAINNTA